MVINLIIFLLGLYCLGIGITFLLYQDKKHHLSQHFWTILIGLTFLITTASVLDVAKVSLNAFMLAKANLMGFQFIFILSAVPIIYWLLSLLEKKKKIGVQKIIPLILFFLMLVFVFSRPNNQPPFPTIIGDVWRSMSISPDYTVSATRYFDGFYSVLSGVKNGSLPSQPVVEGLSFIGIFILGLKIVKSSSKPEFSIIDPLLGGVILSLALIYPALATYNLCFWILLSILNLFWKNKIRAYLILRSILLALILNPLMWGMML